MKDLIEDLTYICNNIGRGTVTPYGMNLIVSKNNNTYFGYRVVRSPDGKVLWITRIGNYEEAKFVANVLCKAYTCLR